MYTKLEIGWMDGDACDVAATATASSSHRLASVITADLPFDVCLYGCYSFPSESLLDRN